MSTNDVPGARPENHDKLAMGCWAEHQDGSLILVESTEANRVIYVIFDTKNMTQYRDAMPEAGFKRQFSWDGKDPKKEKWTWHDKTAFPWERVMKAGYRDGEDFISADDHLTAAERIRESRRRFRGGTPRDITRMHTERDEDDDTAARRVARALDLEAERINPADFSDKIDKLVEAGTAFFGKLMDTITQLPSKAGKGRGARK